MCEVYERQISSNSSSQNGFGADDPMTWVVKGRSVLVSCSASVIAARQ